MKKVRFGILVLSLGYVLGGCEPPGSPGDTSPGAGSPPVGPVLTIDYYVDGATGSDLRSGTSPGQAFKTVTRALSVATTGQTVQVAPGTYDPNHAEILPLVIPAGVVLRGNPDAQGAGTVLAGGGPIPNFRSYSTTVVLSTGSTLSGFTVTGLAGHMGVTLDWVTPPVSAVTVSHNTIQGAKNGLYRLGGTTGTISDNVFQTNQWDIALVGGENTLVITGNTFHDPLEFDGPYGDLGGGAGHSPGHNTFLVSGSWFTGAIFARNNHWPHSPPTGNASLGYDSTLDISNVSSGTLDITGYY